jgi:hypothetical protein
MKQRPFFLIYAIVFLFRVNGNAQEINAGEIKIFPKTESIQEITKQDSILSACELPQSNQQIKLIDAMENPSNIGCKGLQFQLSGNLIVDDEVNITNAYTRMTMASDAMIIVKSNGVLNLSNTLITACDSLWKGIKIETGGIVTLKNSFIEQAILPYPPNEVQSIGSINFYPNPASSETILKFSFDTEINKINQLPDKCIATDELGVSHLLPLKTGSSISECIANFTLLKTGIYQILVSNPIDNQVFMGKVLVAHN